MKKSIHVIISLLAVGLLLATVPAHAAKVHKVDICHLDEDAGIFRLLSVDAKAREPHLKHGDLLPGVDNGDNAINLDEDCLLILPSLVLARAYIDVDDDGEGYDAEHDLDIAILTDADGDGALSIGDQLEVDVFPTSFMPCTGAGVCPEVGTFTTNRTTTVTRVTTHMTYEGDSIRFITDGGLNVEFSHIPGVSEWFLAANLCGPCIGDPWGWLNSVVISDVIVPRSTVHYSASDWIRAGYLTNLQPAPSIWMLAEPHNIDNQHVDVEITPAPWLGL